MNPVIAGGSERQWSRIGVAAAAALGAAWVTGRRDGYRRFSEPLPAEARGRFSRYFSHSLLDRAGVARVPRIRNPLPERLVRLAPGGMLDLSTVRGMAFIDTIVIAEQNSRGGNEVSLLFHELVHLVQYEILGTTGLVHAYLAGWMRAGRSYLDNPLEAMAFRLQSRFDAGEAFDARLEVSGMI